MSSELWCINDLPFFNLVLITLIILQIIKVFGLEGSLGGCLIQLPVQSRVNTEFSLVQRS